MHIGNLDITQLRLIAAVAKSGSVSRAAESIGLSQSAASHALNRLREAADDPIFVRTSGGMRATPYGERVASAVGAALQTLQAGFESGAPFNPATSARNFYAYLSDVGQMVFLPRLLAYLDAHAPTSKFTVLPVPLQRPHEALENGTVDLAIGYFDTLTTGFRKSRLFRERYVSVVRSNHPAFAAGMSLKAFASAQHALADSSGMAHESLEYQLRRRGVQRSIRLVVPQFMVLPLVIARSDLLVTMPSRLAEQFASLAKLKVMPLPFDLEGYDVAMYWHERHQKDPANRWLRGVFTGLFRDTAKLRS